MSENKKVIETFNGIDWVGLNKILSAIQNIKVALIGDLCLDVYWRADMTKSELSRETPHFYLPVVEEWVSPGAGGNVVANLAALDPQRVYVLGVVGRDWRGALLLNEFSKSSKIDTNGIVMSDTVVTNAYCKPLKRGISGVEHEDPRIDFCNYKPLGEKIENELISLLQKTAAEVDVICVSDQFQYGAITPRVREKIIELGRKGHNIIVDSRYRIGLFSDVTLKPNEIEGYLAVHGMNAIAGNELSEKFDAAEKLSGNNNAKVCMTLGKDGCFYTDGSSFIHIPSSEVKPPLDICGAGDTFLSAFSCSVAAGAKGYEAASFANLAAEVTIKKIGTTGTANGAEIRERHEEIFKKQQAACKA